MTTKNFIAKTYNTTATKDRKCSSVFTDDMGVVYSYGYHYPLAFNIAGLDFINTSGYSSSTNRHIAWAKSAVGCTNYIAVKATSEIRAMVVNHINDTTIVLNAILKALNEESERIELLMLSKNRKDTWVYADLQRQYDTLNDNILTIMLTQ